MIQISKTNKGIILVASSLLLSGLAFGSYLLIRTQTEAYSATEVPFTPSNLEVTDNPGQTAVNLTWHDNSTMEQGYKIERSVSPVLGYTEIAQVGVNQTSFTDLNIITGKRYYYRVRSYNQIGDSEYSKANSPTREETADLLLGIGGFDSSKSTSWGRHLTTNDPGHWDWKGGVDISVPGDSVAEGWIRYSSPIIIPGDDTVFDIEKSDGVSYQKMAVKNALSAGQIYLYKSLPIEDSQEYMLHHGDTIVFSMDHIKMADYQGVPVSYSLVCLTADNINASVSSTVPLSPQASSFSGSVQCTIPANNATFLQVSVRLDIGGNIGVQIPSISVSGAHLTLTRSGAESPLSWTIPTPPTRSIQTSRAAYNLANTDLYALARDYNEIFISDSDYPKMGLLRAVNPNMQIYLYESSNVTDNRQQDTSRSPSVYDPLFSNSPIGFAWAIDNHPEWFTEYSEGDGLLSSITDSRPEYRKYNNSGKDEENPEENKLNYVFNPSFQNEYFTDFSNPTFLAVWEEKITGIVNRYGFDGIFIDTLQNESVTGTHTNPDSAVETEAIIYQGRLGIVQGFLKHAMPDMRARGIKTIINACSRHYNTWPGKSYLNPLWDPALDTAGLAGMPSDYSSSDFIKSSSSITPDRFFNESAFFSAFYLKKNIYLLSDWFNTLNDLDHVNELNQATPSADLIKYLQVNARGNNRIDTPFEGIDGWGNYSLSSYLLASSPYSSLAYEKCDYVPIEGGEGETQTCNYVSNDRARLTTKLGNPTGQRQIVYNDIVYQKDDPALDTNSKKTLQFRKFTYGLVVVNGSPDPVDPATNIRDFSVPNDMVDDLGNKYPAGSVISLLPHTGRILFNYPLASANVINEARMRHDYYIDTPKLRLSAVDVLGNSVAKIYYKIGSGEYQEYTTEIDLPDGVYDLKYYAEDDTLPTPISGVENTLSLKIKTAAPTAPTASSSRSFTYKASIALSGSTLGQASLIHLNNTAQTVVSSDWTNTFSLGLGSNSIQVKSEDSAGNESTPTTVTVTRRKVGDTNNDSSVNTSDFSILMANWNRNESANIADFNEDNQVDGTDFSQMMSGWGR